MKKYTFLVTAKTTLSVAGVVHRLSPASHVEFFDSQGEALFRRSIPGSEYLHLISMEDDSPAECEVASSEPHEPLQVPPNEQLQDVYQENPPAEAAAEPSEPIPPVETQPVVQDVPSAPLPPDTHWTQVRSYLTNLGQQSPVDYAQVEAVKNAFPQYTAVQQEADRILAERA
jgi:hypothetical protein